MKPFKMTRESLAKTAAVRWRVVYPASRCCPQKNDVYESLLELGSDPEPDAVDRAIGNKSWTHGHCNACGEYCTGPGPWVQLGEEEDCESATAVVCASCFAEAAALMGVDA